MIIDLTVKNFRSFRDEQMLSMVAESGLSRHRENLKAIEDGKLFVLRSAVILGANASGKSNILKAIQALKWLVGRSGGRDEGAAVLTFEPYKLLAQSKKDPVEIQIEFVVPSGLRYRYEVSFNRERVLTETLHSYSKRQRALVFSRGPEDTWETIKFGSTYKGGNKRISFFPNNSYLSKAGSDASAPSSIREIVRYFRSILVVDTENQLRSSAFYENEEHLNAVAKLLCLVDTGISKITSEENLNIKDMSFPDQMPDEVREAFINANKLSFSFWSEDEGGGLVEFDETEISDGTRKLFEVMPVLFSALARGVPIFMDELDGHLHTSLVGLILDIFNDSETNPNGGQIIFTTHDTNVLDPGKLRRDQVWFVSKENGASNLKALDSFDKKYVRPDSPFENFYMDGRFGALPSVDISKIRQVLSDVRLSEEVGRGVR